MSAAHERPASTRDTPTRKMLAELQGEELVKWRVADFPDRMTADERNMPHEFPMGWFAICYSDELAVGEVKPIRCFGQDVALWRGEDGKARVINAFCGHYGANMAQGGVVNGNLLECQFHAWKWEGDGSCREIPYAKNIPPQAKRKDCIPSWPVAECNGFVHVWYHPEKAEPEWDCVVFDEVGKPDWSPFQKFEWKLYCSMEQLSNQAVDTAHFRYVHGTQNVPTGDFEFDGVCKKSVSYPKLETPRGVVNGQIASIGHGPGQGLTRFSGICETIQLSAIMPIERDVLLVRFALSQPLDQATGRGVAKAIIRDLTSQLDQDKLIIDRIMFLDRPLVCDGDGPFGRQRQYFQQFYASKRLKAA